MFRNALHRGGVGAGHDDPSSDFQTFIRLHGHEELATGVNAENAVKFLLGFSN